MKAVIIEDETAAVISLKAILGQNSVMPVEIVAELDSINESVDYFRSKPNPDIIFMDIHLADHGTTTADRVHQREEFRLLMGDVQELAETQRTALLLREIDNLLEEIVGNIYDEFDPAEESEIVQISENLWRCEGSVDLETLAETLDVELSLDEEYDTLGGMVLSCFSTIPEDGSKPVVDVNGLHIQVEKIDEHRIETALVSKILPSPEPELPEENR